MKKLPNIIICTCDQLRAFELGCYGNKIIRTPNLDRLAAEGIRFETAVTNYPVCMASRSVLLSGQYNRTCTGGVGNVSLPGNPGEVNLPEYPYHGRPHLPSTTLPEILRDAGYATTVIGKWHVHSWPHDVGFDEYLIPRVHHTHTAQCYTRNGGPEFCAPGYSVNFEAEKVEAFLKGQAEGAPFFLYYNISIPHCPIADAPERYRTMYSSDEVPIRANVDSERRIENQDHYFKIYRHDYKYYNLHLPYAETLPESYSIRHVIAEYCGITTWMDETVGRMLDVLQETGLAEDTIVVFTSDHGDNLGSHGLVQKGTPNEESIRIPLIMQLPGSEARQPGVIDSHVTSIVDVAPTILSLIGAEIPEHFHGRDMADLTTVGNDTNSATETSAIIETGHGAAVRSPSHMYFVPYSGEDRAFAKAPSQFYDVTADPYQLENLAGRDELGDASAAEASRLDSILRRWDASTPWMR